MTLSAVKPGNALPDLGSVTLVDEVGVRERAARFQTRSIKKESKVEALRMVLSMIDLTTLEGQDTPGTPDWGCRAFEFDGEPQLS